MSIETSQEHLTSGIPAVPVVHSTLETFIEELQRIERASLRGLRVTTRSFWFREVGIDNFTVKVIVSALTVQEGTVQILFWTWLAGQFAEVEGGSPWGTPTRKEVVGRAMQAQQKVMKILSAQLGQPDVGEGVYYLGAEVLRTIGTTDLFTVASAGRKAIE